MSTFSSLRRPALPVLLCLLVVVSPVTLSAATELGAATPEELVERLQRSAENEDFAELAACLAPEDRAVTALMMILGAGMMTAFAQMGSGMAEGMIEGMAEAFGAEPVEESPEAAAAVSDAAAEAAAAEVRFEELLERHGVAALMEEDVEPGTGGPEAAARLLADVDQVALIADLMLFMRESFPETGEETPASVPAGVLEGLVVDGDRARGRIGEEEVGFVRIDGRWFFELEAADEEAAPDAEPAWDGGDPSGR
ncbi:MAG TPA: hypothetical protein VM617_04520 [Thermoanaerobaculia bacterium]|nr:hypothetical protein [Thermoanaerobaculia bacterium]